MARYVRSQVKKVTGVQERRLIVSDERIGYLWISTGLRE
jgi:hypothetical protein